MPSLTRDAGRDTQTGKAEQVWWEKPGSATVHDAQSHPTVTRQVWGLARKASQWVRSSEGCGWAQDKMLHSSRDEMQRLSLNVPPEKEGGMPATRLLYSSDMAVSTAFWSKATVPQQNCLWAWETHPCTWGVCRGSWHRALCFGTRKYWNIQWKVWTILLNIHDNYQKRKYYWKIRCLKSTKRTIQCSDIT